jgi:hypothetical protein
VRQLVIRRERGLQRFRSIRAGAGQSFTQWIIQVEPGRSTPTPRWGLLAAAMFADKRPNVFSGWAWHFLSTRRD